LQHPNRSVLSGQKKGTHQRSPFDSGMIGVKIKATLGEIKRRRGSAPIKPVGQRLVPERNRRLIALVKKIDTRAQRFTV